MKVSTLSAAAGVLLLGSAASAHVRLDAPLVRYADDSAQKDGPCGLTDGPRKPDRVTVFKPGETITVTFTETVYHDGYFRIAFDQDGDDGFIDPNTGQNVYNSEEVLLDHILIAPSEERPDNSKLTYDIEVTLPDVECANCTLQLIQVMTSNLDAPLTPTNIYYRCANIVLSEDGTIPDAGPGGSEPDAGLDPEPSGPDAGDPSNPAADDPVGGGCAVGNESGAGAMLLLALALAALRRRQARW